MSINNDYGQMINSAAASYLSPPPMQDHMNALNGAQMRDTLPDKIKRIYMVLRHRAQHQKALEEVVSFFQAQANIEPFRSNPEAQVIYEQAMSAALEELRKFS